ncbi:MAG TPA: alpha/beta hydrolase [Conexibacter sp.]|jgi:pimeloyl-ACP methyl ester carboxylesterase
MGVAERSGTVRVGGRVVAWRALGSGPPLLLVNGYAGTSSDWDPRFLDALARSFELILPDNRGVGGSDRGAPEDMLTIDALARDVERVLDACGIERAHLAGWSMGGYIVQRLTALAPARVQSLALLATDPGGPEAVISTREAWETLTDDSGTPRAQARRLIELLFPPGVSAQVDAEAGEVVAAGRARLSRGALRAQEAAIIAFHRKEPSPLAPEAIPSVLIVHGDADVVIPPANAALLERRWPGARVERIAGAGHAFMAQEPERVAALMRELALG